MSKHILNNAGITIGTVNLSTHFNNVEVNLSREMHDVTGFQDAGMVTLPGDRNDSVNADIFQDFDAGQIDATLFPLFDNATEFALAITPGSGTVTSTNPSYSGSAVLTEYNPIRGRRGDVHQISCVFHINGKMSRGTA